jgi:hypothetical protein
MRLNFLSFSNLTLLVALSLSSVAAWYSIIGLTAIFAGAVIPVIIMGSILEVGKITTTVWLRKYWHRASWVLKLYLVPAVIALALLTSMGIFGFLSKAHMDQGITSGDVQAKLALYDEKIKTQRDNIELARKALTQMDNQVDQRLSRGDSETSAERAVQIRRQQQGERAKLQKDIGEAQSIIAKLNEERAPIAAENRKVEAEVGPIKYIAALIYGDTTDNNTLESAVRWVIILLVIVFDPLAIALVLAANASKEWDKEAGDSPLGNETPSTPTVTEPLPEGWPYPDYEPDDGPLTEEQLEQIKETVKQSVNDIEVTDEEEEAFKELEPKPSDPTLDPCYKCGTPLMNAPGIGPFCPNKECDVKDETVIEEEIVEEPKSLLEQHPYLNQPFVSFDTKPMVYKPEPEVIEPVITAEELTADTEVLITTPKPYKELEGGYVMFEDKHYQLDALKSLRPDLFMLTADGQRSISTNFGIKFPNSANKGDVFVRVDALPNTVYKYDGRKWIEVRKDQSDTYLHNQNYVKYLVEKLEKGEYDPDLLSDTERDQIELYLKNQNS